MQIVSAHYCLVVTISVHKQFGAGCFDATFLFIHLHVQFTVCLWIILGDLEIKIKQIITCSKEKCAGYKVSCTITAQCSDLNYAFIMFFDMFSY